VLPVEASRQIGEAPVFAAGVQICLPGQLLEIPPGVGGVANEIPRPLEDAEAMAL
jgi:hypothetical protein